MRHQVYNAVTVLNAVDQLRAAGWKIDEVAVQNGFFSARWPTRFEVLCRYPLFILDDAHNPQCMETLTDNLKTLIPEGGITFLTGMLADKDYGSMIGMIKPFAKWIVCLTPDSERALPAEQMAKCVEGKGIQARAAHDSREGIGMALDAADGEPIVAMGSLYLAGSIRENVIGVMKKWQRKQAIRARESLTAEQRRIFSHQIVQRILESEEYQRAKTILSYRAVKAEVNLDELDEAARLAGKRVAYPRCISGTVMIALDPNNSKDREKNHYGILEPIIEASPPIDPSEIDLVLCPCSAFDSECNRLGMGGGYYDRHLQNCSRARICAVAFEVQKIPELCTDEWDCGMKSIFTELRQY